MRYITVNPILFRRLPEKINARGCENEKLASVPWQPTESFSRFFITTFGKQWLVPRIVYVHRVIAFRIIKNFK